MLIKELKTIQGVFCVMQTNENNTTEWSVAVNPKINPTIQRVTWNDGGRGRLIEYSSLKDVNVDFSSGIESTNDDCSKAKKISIIDRKNRFVFTLEPLTLSLYDQRIKKTLCEQPVFKNQNQLIDFFKGLETRFGA